MAQRRLAHRDRVRAICRHIRGRPSRPTFIILSKTPYLAVLAVASLWLRKAWSQVGFRVGPHAMRLILAGIAAGVAMEAFELFVSQPFLETAFAQPPDLSDFESLKGNVQLLALYLALTWTLAAFGEEFVYRGYLLNRLEDLTKGPASWLFALVASSLIFGLAHLYQGITGITENVIDGALLGLMYLASGRRFIVPFIAHGVQDTTDVLLIFSGHYPTLQ